MYEYTGSTNMNFQNVQVSSKKPDETVEEEEEEESNRAKNLSSDFEDESRFVKYWVDYANGTFVDYFGLNVLIFGTCVFLGRCPWNAPYAYEYGLMCCPVKKECWDQMSWQYPSLTIESACCMYGGRKCPYEKCA